MEEDEYCPAELTASGIASDGTHCNCWYDGKACCRCGAPEQKEEEND